MHKNQSVLISLFFLLMLTCFSRCSNKNDYPGQGSINRLSPAIDEIIAPGILPEVLAYGFEWSEGPLWLPEQEMLIFSDIPRNTIFSWSEKEGLKSYLHPAGYTGSLPRGGESGSNGLLLDEEGRLLLCQHGDRRIARMNSPPTNPKASFTTLCDKWQGKKFNSPNDAVLSKEAFLYFTDPSYGMEFGFDDPLREMDFTGVFCKDPDGKITLVTDALSAPNGIGLSPDESRLYVANSGRSSGLIWKVFDRAPDGSCSNERLFYDAGPAGDTLKGAPDGLVVRSDGTIFASGPGGVWIFQADGTHLGIIRTGRATSNCTLDSAENHLYMTADNLLMRIELL